MTDEEFTQERLRCVLKLPKHLKSNSEEDPDISDLPEEVDWVSKGVVTEPRNQGHCGSCYAFAAVEAIESAVAMAGGELQDLSVQQIVDCAVGDYGNLGCNGGLMNFVYDYLLEAGGIQKESDYSYIAHHKHCRAEPEKFV